ncbi:hypothetical protein V5799_009010 [Amblyomma americanum]|uniref:THAP-type domain-containing protein n=1 Tax=Amblyomma americanum TaxID=6943 RepID=A0AAQ4FDE8_AMBAM
MWIDNIRKARGDTDGVWSPTKYSKVCSRHFVGNTKGEDPRTENYAPTIFPFVKKETAQKYNMHLAARQRAKQSQQKLTEASETPSLGGVAKHPLPSSNAATAELAGGATMEGQVRSFLVTCLFLTFLTTTYKCSKRRKFLASFAMQITTRVAKRLVSFE